MTMNELLRRYYYFVKTSPCLACGKPPPSEVAHISIVASEKLPGRFLPREHKGYAAYGAIPLCAQCHRLDKDAIHNHNEEEWLERNIKGGKAYAIGWALRTLIEVAEELVIE